MIHFVGISTVVCGSFLGVGKIQNGGRCHGNQGTMAANYKNPPIWVKFCFQLDYDVANKGNNKITELRTILQRESQNS